MGLPVISEAMRIMFERGSTLALARLERILSDPKASNREVIEVAKLYLSRTAPEPKVDSASSAGRTTLMIAPSSTVAAIMEKGKALLPQPVSLIESEDDEPEDATVEDQAEDQD